MPKFPLPLLILVIGLSLFMEETSSSSSSSSGDIIDERIMDEDVGTMVIGDNEKNEEEEDDSSVSEWNSINKFKRSTDSEDDADEEDEDEEGHVPEGRKKGHHGKKCRGKNGRHGCSHGHTCVRTCRSKCVRKSSALDVPPSCLATDKIRISEKCDVQYDGNKIISMNNTSCCTGNCVKTGTDIQGKELAHCCLGPNKVGSDCSATNPGECCSGHCQDLKSGTISVGMSCCKGRGGVTGGPCDTDADCCFTVCGMDKKCE